MQGRIDPPRQDLAVADVEALIVADSLEVAAGLELADDSGWRDISDRLSPAGSSVAHNNFATIHGSCTLRVREALDWGAARVRPYVTLSDGTTEATFRLGVYSLSTPVRSIGETPESYEVEGYDNLLWLSRLVGGSFAADAGASVDDVLADVFDTYGAPDGYLIEPSDAVIGSVARVWPLDDQTTWLRIVNDLCEFSGRRGVWCDWEGRYRIEAYREPSGQANEWTYDADDAETIVGAVREVEADFFEAPNRWVFVRNDPNEGVADSTSGVYEVLNESDGPTSSDARGQTITRVLYLDAADDASLQAQGDSIVARSKFLDTTFNLTVGPNPLHWHADVVGYKDAEYGGLVKTTAWDWRLPFDGSDMDLRLRRVAT